MSTSWRDLPAPLRVEVWRLAKEGERHPDPEVADSMYRWAVGQVSKRGTIRSSIAVLVDVGLGGGAGGSAIVFNERRVAKRLAAIGPRPMP